MTKAGNPGEFGSLLQSTVSHEMAEAFASTYWVSAFLCLGTLAVALFLPRRREESHLLDEEPEGTDTPPVVVH